MNEKFLNQLLASGIRSGRVDLELNDTIVDGLMEMHQGELSDDLKVLLKSKLKTKIVEAAIASARKSIPWKGLPFGRYIEQVRSRAGLARSVLAEWLGQSDEYLQRIERGDANPTQLAPKDVIRILELFHIRLNAMSEMLVSSVCASQSKQTYRAAARSHGGLRHDVRSEDVERALDAFTRKLHKRSQEYQHNESDVPSEVKGYLDKLERELKKRGRTDLVS